MVIGSLSELTHNNKDTSGVIRLCEEQGDEASQALIM
jgi:hypothetical protein